MSANIATGSQLASNLSNEIQGKVILTTGVSAGGLGETFMQTISKHNPKLLILAGRSESKLQETKEKLGKQVNTRILVLDLSSQKQIRQAAEQVLAYEEAVDVIVNNAGIMATPFSKTLDGIEMQFGCNHIGHFLFTNLIMPKLIQSKSARIINVSSNGYRLSPVRFQDHNFQDGAYYNKWRAYGQSKTANMLFSIALAKRLERHGILSLSLHPGVIKTNLSGHMERAEFQELFEMDKSDGFNKMGEGFTYKTPDEGTATHVYAAFQPGLEKDNGGYLDDCRVQSSEEILSWGRDQIGADMLWSLSETLVGQSFNF